jgi:hypothetical protein
MLKQNITYTDFNGTKRTEDLYFNLSEFELVELQAGSEKGIQADLQEAINNKDIRALLAFIKMLVNKAYGIKSEDGRHFDKSEEITRRFENSALYSDLLLHLFEDEGARAEKFITGLMPKDLIERATARTQAQSAEAQGYLPDARELAARHRAQQNIPEPTFQEAPAIGDTTALQFQAPSVPEEVPIIPGGYTHVPAQVPPHQQNVQPDPATVDARVESPNLDATENRPFRVKETPIETPSGDAISGPRDSDEQSEFEAWRAAQRNNQQ